MSYNELKRMKTIELHKLMAGCDEKTKAVIRRILSERAQWAKAKRADRKKGKRKKQNEDLDKKEARKDALIRRRRITTHRNEA